MADLDAVIQIFPVDGVIAGFERPLGALFGRSVRQPLEPLHTLERQADFASVGELHAQHVARGCNTGCAHCFGCLSGQSVQASLQGSSMPKSRQIFRTRQRLISVWRGTDERRLSAGFSHHEWQAPSRTSRQPCAVRWRMNSRRFTLESRLLRNHPRRPFARRRD